MEYSRGMRLWKRVATICRIRESSYTLDLDAIFIKLGETNAKYSYLKEKGDMPMRMALLLLTAHMDPFLDFPGWSTFSLTFTEGVEK